MINLDQGRKMEQSAYGEAVRLSNELRNHPAIDIKDNNHEEHSPEKTDGFDIETCASSDITSWLDDNTNKKSNSLLAFVCRVFSVRFPAEFLTYQQKASLKLKDELTAIHDNSINDPNWFGQVGFSGMETITKKRIV